MRINGVELTDGERGIYGKAATRARLAYLKRHGSAATVNVAGQVTTASKVHAHAAAWRLEHGAAYDAAADRAGVAAVKKLHTARAVTGYGPATARLEALGLTGKRAATSRKRATVTPVAVADVPATPVVVPVTVPDVAVVTVPAPMPEQTRAARRASNRELAAAMRAVGLEPRGDAWHLARTGMPLEDIAGQVAAVGGAA